MTNDLYEAGGNDNSTNVSNNDDTITVDQLVGDDKQYSTVDELAKAKRHADQFIEQLKSELSSIRDENKTLRDEANTRERLEEILDQLNSRNQSQYDEDLDGDNQNPPPRSSQPDTNIDSLIEAKLTQLERERTANQNRSEAIKKLKEAFGNDYKSRLEQRTEELGLTKEEMNSLAGRSPTAFLELVAPKGLSNTDDRPVSVPRSSVNPGRPNSDPQAGTAEFYKNLKKNDPDKYWSPKVQNQLHKDAIRAANEGRSFEI